MQLQFLIASFEKTCQKLGLRASSRPPNTSTQMKALNLQTRAFILYLGVETRDEALTFVLDILHEQVQFRVLDTFCFDYELQYFPAKLLEISWSTETQLVLD